MTSNPDMDPEHILFIHPKNRKPSTPINDEVTKTIEYLFSNATEYGSRFRGFHMCICGKHSDNVNYMLPNGMVTNSLCIHYIRDHRDEVPQKDIDKLMGRYTAK
jgi:hypothetical protein